MKSSVRHFMKRYWLISPIILTAIALVTGCITARHHPNPLAGWKVDFNHSPDQVIVKDYQGYIQKLPPKEKKYVGPIEWFKDGKGQHAIRITIGINGTVWRHVLIYNKDNRRIETIKYASGDYHS